MSRFKEIPIGSKFGQWTVLSFHGKRGKCHASYWNCRCDCGYEYPIDGYALRNGKSLRCIKCVNKIAVPLAINTNSKKALKYSGDGKGALRDLYKSYKFTATRRGLVFDISLELFSTLTKQPCHYCNRPPSSKAK